MVTVIIPAREEKYLKQTLDNVLSNARGEIEIRVMLDGWIPEPQIVMNDDRVIFHHFPESIGQRQCINEGARRAKGKYIMKLDAHCAVDEGFDVKLAKDCEYDWTVVPRMYNLDIETFKPKLHKLTDYMYISSPTAEKPFRAKYYTGREYRKQHSNKKLIDDTMCCMGPGWFMHTERYWELEGMDEGHGGWGQMGIEVALKAWLSGGKLVVNKNTWFAHYFRGNIGFPYSLSGRDVSKARKHSQDLWLNNKWDKATRKLSWVVDKFKPPTWNNLTILYYTDDKIEEPLKTRCLKHLKSHGIPVIEEHNKVDDRSHLQMFSNILRGLERITTKYVAMAEHDCLYPKEHFEFVPPKDDIFYYDTNHWWVDYKSGKYFQPYANRAALSGLVCNTELLKKAVIKRIEFLNNGGVLQRGIKGACEFGIVDDYKSELFKSTIPYLDIRWGHNFSGNRRSKRKSSSLPYWGTFNLAPVGKWYQEATINGEVMPTRRKNDTSEGRWNKLIKPLVPTGSVFVELGCNAGFYLRKAVDMGFKAMGVEKEPIFINHALYWESCEPKGVTVVDGDINDYDIPLSSVVLIANVHYWLTNEQLVKIVEKLKNKAVHCIIVGRYRTLDVHKSPCDLEYVKGLFSSWEMGKVIKGRKHYSVIFKNPSLVEVDTDNLIHHQQLWKSKRFLPSYSKLVKTGDNKDYVEYLKWRKFRNKKALIRRHTRLIESVKKNGLTEPLMLEGNKVVDGDHRLIIARETGIKSIICFIEKSTEK